MASTQPPPHQTRSRAGAVDTAAAGRAGRGDAPGRVVAASQASADSSEHQRIAVVDETVQAFVRLRGTPRSAESASCHSTSIVVSDPDSAQQHAASQPLCIRSDSLAQQFATGGRLEFGENRERCVETLRIKRGLHAATADAASLRKADSPCREHAGEWMHHELVDAEQLRDGTGMLAGGAAERQQREPGRILAVPQREFPDGVGHLRNRDLDESLGE